LPNHRFSFMAEEKKLDILWSEVPKWERGGVSPGVRRETGTLWGFSSKVGKKAKKRMVKEKKGKGV